jgi:NAD(P)H-dependent FMN reductase
VRLLLISGSTRDGSSNGAALRTLQAIAPSSVTAVLYPGLSGLPAFNPDDDHAPLPPAVAELRQQIAAAGAVLFCVPEYAGLMPGSLKNLLDWTVGGTEMSGKPTAWINVAAAGRGAGAQRALATVLEYVGVAVIEPACRDLPLAPGSAGPDGLIADPVFRAGLTEVTQAIIAASAPAA